VLNSVNCGVDLGI